MATLAKLVVKLVGDVSEFTSSMDSAQKKLTTIGKDTAAVGDKLTKNVSAPLLALGGIALNAASDLDETRNKTAVVFGAMSEDIFAFADDSAVAYGMSEQSALDYASTYGSLLKNTGLAEEQTSAMSQSLVQLTSDYASFHNLKPEEAFEKIKAGLVGSSEPLQALGKDLKVSAVNAYAMANGIGAADGSMTNAELALARYGTLMSQSGDEIGDFQKTSDGLANSSRIMGAEFGNLSAEMGELLIPTAVEFMQALLPILHGLNAMPDSTKQNIVQVLAFAAAMGPVLSVLGRLIQFGGWIAGLFGSGGALAGAWTWITATAVPALGGSFSAIGGFLAAVSLPVWALIAAIGALVFVIIKFGADAWATIQTIGRLIPATLLLLRIKIDTFFREMATKIRQKISDFKQIGRDIIQGFIDGVKAKVQTLKDSILNPIKDVWNEITSFWQIGSPSKLAYSLTKNIMLGGEEGAEDYASKPQQAISGAFATAMPSFAGVGASGGAPVVIEYKPVLSMGNKEELIEALVPVIREVLRQK